MRNANSFGTFLEAINKETPPKVHIEFSAENKHSWCWIHINDNLIYDGEGEDVLGILRALFGTDNVTYSEEEDEQDYCCGGSCHCCGRCDCYEQDETPEQEQEAWANIATAGAGEVFRHLDAVEAAQEERDGTCICGAGCCCIDGCVGACPGHTKAAQEAFWTAYYKGNPHLKPDTKENNLNQVKDLCIQNLYIPGRN